MPRGRERYMRMRRDRRDYREYPMDYADRNYREDNEREYDPYKQPYLRRAVEKDYRDYRDMRGYGDYRSDYRDMRDYDDYDKEYENDLRMWTEKLKKYDRFGLSKEQVTQKAKDMKVDFRDYDENEFYAIYLMHVSDYPQLANEPHTYLAMAKAWLEDKDIKIDPSEKVCKYMYEIVMADE